MFGRMRHWVAVGAVLAGFAAGVAAAPGYLPVVGPVPLRFRPAIQPETNMVRIPLPPPNLPPPAPEIPPAPPAATNTVAQKTPPAASPPAAPAPATVSSNQANAEGTFSPAEPLISPQMLMRYFNKSTNGASGGIMAPVNFAPPAAVSPPSSTATYSTDPK